MKNLDQHIINTRSIGVIASEILSKDQDARIFGKTSKGIYIKTSGKWLVFLSFEQFRGPLTITLKEVDPILQRLSTGIPVHIASQSLCIPNLDVRIKIQGGEIWRPAITSVPKLYDLERQPKLVGFTNELMIKEKGIGLGYLLPLLLVQPDSLPEPQITRYIHWNDIQQIQKHLRNGETGSLARLLSNLLGSGPGLTPSADDFAMGMLLSLNRWQNPHWTAAGLRDLNLEVVEAAYAKTNALSANLIECATLGFADEGLINALDWLVTGVNREPEVVEHLKGWGNSSGIDAFVGMVVTLTG
jgi:hypothetical protein